MSALSLFRLDGRVAFITGGAQGIGFAVAKALCEAGATVVIADIEGGPLAEAGAALRTSGCTIETRLLDVTDSEHVREVADGVVAAHGRIDVLVNNAGIAQRHACGGRGGRALEERARR